VAVGNNITATFSETVQGVNTTTFFVRSNAVPNTAIAATVSRDGTTNRWILNPNANLAAGTTYTVTLTGGATAIRDAQNAPLATTTWSFTTAGGTTAATVPAQPAAPVATAGAAGGAVNATVTWTAPANDGGSPITGYIVRWQRVGAGGGVADSGTVRVGATVRTLTQTLPVANANYRFQVRAVNAVGNGPFSASSNTVIGR
jgi:hypothetical protein